MKLLLELYMFLMESGVIPGTENSIDLVNYFF